MSTTNLQPEPVLETPKKQLVLKTFGIGSAGLGVLEQMMAESSTMGLVAVATDAQALAKSSAAEKALLETRLLRGLGTGGDPDRGRDIAEEHLPKLKALCEGADVIFIVAGLGGGAGTGMAPVLARVAKETGALVLGFVTTPFECEGVRRERQAQLGLEELKEAADGVICLPNQVLFKLIDENTSVLDTFKRSNELLADAVRGIWRLLMHKGLIEIPFEELCSLLRDRHGESAFAVAEAIGPTRSREVLDKLFAHPMLDGGGALAEAELVVVSLMGGPDLTMVEVNRVMTEIKQRCDRTQILMGAALDESFRERLAVTLIAGRKGSDEPGPLRLPGEREELDQQLLKPSESARPGSRILPPPPPMSLEKLDSLMERQKATGGSRVRKNIAKMRQGQLPLEIVSKGRFDKSEPTIIKGEDLDVPTYIRRGVALN